VSVWPASGRFKQNAAQLVGVVDGDGRARRGIREPERLVAETGMEISVRHFPPGTSKSNKVEHRCG